MDVGAESSTESDGGYAARQDADPALTPARAAARRDAAALLISRAREAQLRAAMMQWLLATTRVKREPDDEPGAGGGADAPAEHAAALHVARELPALLRAMTAAITAQSAQLAALADATTDAGVKPPRIKDHPASGKRARVSWLLAFEQQARLSRKRTGTNTLTGWPLAELRRAIAQDGEWLRRVDHAILTGSVDASGTDALLGTIALAESLADTRAAREWHDSTRRFPACNAIGGKPTASQLRTALATFIDTVLNAGVRQARRAAWPQRTLREFARAIDDASLRDIIMGAAGDMVPSRGCDFGVSLYEWRRPLCTRSRVPHASSHRRRLARARRPSARARPRFP